MDETPPYLALADRLDKEIKKGVYGLAGALPGANELAKSSGHSRATVYKSIAELLHRGVIVSRNRKLFVNPSAVERDTLNMTGYIPPLPVRAKVQGKKASSKNVAIATIQLPDEIADLLQVARETQVTLRVRIGSEILESGEERPFRVSKYYYLMPLSNEQVKEIEEMADTDLLVQYATPYLQAHDEVIARLPTKEEAAYLRIPESVPVMQLHIVTREAASGNILLFQELTLLGVTLTYDYEFVNRPKS